MSIEATPKSPTANSYLTVEEADSLLTGERLFSEVWQALTTAQKEAALKWSTTLIDSCFEFSGYRTSLAQALRWPRSGCFDLDSVEFDKDAIPKPIKLATSSLALSLASSNRFDEPETLGLGISSLSVGSVSVSIDKNQVFNLIPRVIEVLMQGLGRRAVNTGPGFIEVKLMRT